jgi:hypothetical protein
MVVLAWVPEVDIEKFKPFGLEVSAGSALSIWALLSCVLIYYFANFMFTSWIERRSWNLEVGQEHRTHGIGFDPNAVALSKAQPKISWDIKSFRWRMMADIGLPIISFFSALAAAIWSMVKLWPA